MATYIKNGGLTIVISSNPKIGDTCMVLNDNLTVHKAYIVEMDDEKVCMDVGSERLEVDFKVFKPEQLVEQSYIKFEDLYNTLCKYGSKSVYFVFNIDANETAIAARDIRFKVVLDEPSVPYYVKSFKHDSVVLRTDETLKGIFVDLELSEVELNSYLRNPDDGVTVIADGKKS